MSILTRTQYLGHLPRWFMMTDGKYLVEWKKLLENIPMGTGVIFRDYDHPQRRHLAYEYAEYCARRNLILLVSGDIGLSRELGVGVHMPEKQASSLVRQTVPPKTLVTQSAHNLKALLSAMRNKADAVIVSPVFATMSHPDVRPLGVVRFAQLCRMTTIPIFALGGINATNIRRLRPTSVRGYVAMRYFKSYL